MRDWRVWFFMVVMTALVILGHECDHLKAHTQDDEFAYAAGTTVQTTGEGALIYCHEEPVYFPIKHTAPMSALLRRYVEAVCS